MLRRPIESALEAPIGTFQAVSEAQETFVSRVQVHQDAKLKRRVRARRMIAIRSFRTIARMFGSTASDVTVGDVLLETDPVVAGHPGWFRGLETESVSVVRGALGK